MNEGSKLHRQPLAVAVLSVDGLSSWKLKECVRQLSADCVEPSLYSKIKKRTKCQLAHSVTVAYQL